MIKVIVIDDHPVVREGLKQIIGETLGMTVVAETGDGNQAFALVKNTPCDVVLLDIGLPHKSGLDILKELRAAIPRVPVLIISSHSEDQYAIRCLRAGAAGYLHKESVLAEAVRAIRKVIRGGKYLSESLADRIALDPDYDGRPGHERLSDREYQVVCMLASGKTVTEIAAELKLSVKTINTYRVRVLGKLDVKRTGEITRYAIKKGLVS